MPAPRLLMVLTSNDRMGKDGEPTGFWLEEFAAPYYAFTDNDLKVTVASIAGGKPPIDPRSRLAEAATPATQRFKDDLEAKATVATSRSLAEIEARKYDAVFFAGGHGPMWEYPGNAMLAHLVRAFDDAQKPIAALWHGAVALVDVKVANGKPFVAGRTVTAFTNSEEAAVGLGEVVPFRLEDRLKQLGAVFLKGDDFGAHTVTCGNLITGQNPQSSIRTAEAMLLALDGH